MFEAVKLDETAGQLNSVFYGELCGRRRYRSWLVSAAIEVTSLAATSVTGV